MRTMDTPSEGPIDTGCVQNVSHHRGLFLHPHFGPEPDIDLAPVWL